MTNKIAANKGQDHRKIFDGPAEGCLAECAEEEKIVGKNVPHTSSSASSSASSSEQGKNALRQLGQPAQVPGRRQMQEGTAGGQAFTSLITPRSAPTIADGILLKDAVGNVG